MKVLSSKGDSSEHPIDRQYQSLHCLMEPLDRDHAHFKVRETHPLSQPHSRHSSSSQMVETYLRQTHGHTHSQYSLSVLDVFAVDKEGEQERFKDIGNRWAPVICRHLPLVQCTCPAPSRMLLWHGSRLTNWVGILSQGLRIAPPEAPITGYMVCWRKDRSLWCAVVCFPSPPLSPLPSLLSPPLPSPPHSPASVWQGGVLCRYVF